MCVRRLYVERAIIHDMNDGDNEIIIIIILNEDEL